MWTKMPEAIKPLAKDVIWNFSREEPDIFLTFDDGPTPGVTDRVLDYLKEFDAKATFFCVGGNVQKHPELFQRILSEGHAVGNHTWNHMNGRKFSDFSYYKNILQCATLVDTSLFRPPYGMLRRSQVKVLKKRFDIIMWDILTGDWRKDVSKEECLENAVRHTQNGAIIVMHDSKKAERNVLYTLPGALKIWKARGFSMKTIPNRVSVSED